MRKSYLGTINAQQSKQFETELIQLAHALRANKHDLSVIEVIKLREGGDMKHENRTRLSEQSRAEQSRAEQSRAESGLLALWTIGLTTLLNLLIEYMMKTASALRYLLAVEVEYSRR